MGTNKPRLNPRTPKGYEFWVYPFLDGAVLHQKELVYNMGVLLAGRAGSNYG